MLSSSTQRSSVADSLEFVPSSELRCCQIRCSKQQPEYSLQVQEAGLVFAHWACRTRIKTSWHCWPSAGLRKCDVSCCFHCELRKPDAFKFYTQSHFTLDKNKRPLTPTSGFCLQCGAEASAFISGSHFHRFLRHEAMTCVEAGVCVSPFKTAFEHQSVTCDFQR